MAQITKLETERLIMRQWLPSDYSLFSVINADPAVMKYYPNIFTEQKSNEFAKKCETLISNNGWGFWAVELKNSSEFIGFVGLHNPEAKLPFSPCTEIGWRISNLYWGHGYATEAGNAALKFAFEQLKLDEVISFASLKNKKSIRVMEKLNMVNTFSNFNHPSIPKGHDLQEHVLYKIIKKNWDNKNL